MKTTLLSQIGRAALIAFIGALGMFSAEMANLLPELSGINTLVVTGLIGLVSFVVERLRDMYNQTQQIRSFSADEVNLINRLGRALLTALVGGLVLLLSEIGGILPDLGGILEVAMGATAGLLSLLIEYMRDKFELPATV